jgi:hypothetical protein
MMEIVDMRMIKAGAVMMCLAVGAFAFSPPRFPVSYPTGDLVGFDVSLSSLVIEQHDVFLDLSQRPNARSRIRYVVANPNAESVTAALYFITPFVKDLSVTVNQKRPVPAAERVSPDRLGWQMPAPGARERDIPTELTAGIFSVEFRGGAKTHIEVSFRLPPGVRENRTAYLYPAAINHLNNVFRDLYLSETFVFHLASSSTFNTGHGQAAVEIIAPAGNALTANFALREQGVENGFTKHSGTIGTGDLISLEVKLITDHAPTILGATFALGFVTDYDGYLEFMTQAFFDVFLYNHQLSAGIEANPFGAVASIKLPVLYTFFFGAQGDSFNVLFGGISLTAGALFAVAPVVRTGFRVSIAVALFGRNEMAIDFYPFEAGGVAWQMTFMFSKLSL